MVKKRNSLLSSYQLTSRLTLKNSIVMAPMTQAKANDENIPTLQMVEYYRRRADAGLIITEGTAISENATGYANVPGIYNQVQIDAWRKVTNAVHQKAGLIFLQLWHVGRVSHPTFLNGSLPISASATMMSGRVKRSEGLFYGQSRAATHAEIKQLISDYVNASKNAIAAGFDGVELHGANGYLIDQFLHFDTNHRTDKYGETPENMSRFALDMIMAVGNTIGFDKIGLRLSPGAYLNEVRGDKRDKEVFAFLLHRLNDMPLAYVHTGNFDDKVKFKALGDLTMTQFMREHYKGHLIACGSYDLHEAEKKVLNKAFDLVAIGRPFIANPDLIDKVRQQDALIQYEPTMLETLY